MAVVGAFEFADPKCRTYTCESVSDQGERMLEAHPVQTKNREWQNTVGSAGSLLSIRFQDNGVAPCGDRKLTRTGHAPAGTGSGGITVTAVVLVSSRRVGDQFRLPRVDITAMR